MPNTYKKLILFFCLCTVSISNYAQEVRVIDNKGTINTIRNNQVTTSATAPVDPLEGDVWFDNTISTNVIPKIWNGSAWAVVGGISTDANNAISTGSDGGAYLKTQFFTAESSGTQNWGTTELTVASHTITLTVECIVDVSYIFSYERRNGGSSWRFVNVDVTGSTTLNNQMSTITSYYGSSFLNRFHNSANRKYRLTPGTYTFTMRTDGGNNIRTHTQTDNSLGWSFDITTIATN